MSIFDIFKGNPAPAAQQAPAQQPAGQQPAATAGTTQAATSATTTQEPAAVADPMEAFKDLWAPAKEGDPQPANFDPSKMFQIDPNKIQEAVGQMNFASSVTPETLAAIQAGGEDATKAFLTAMNGVAQQAFAQSMIGSAKLVEQAMTKANGSLDARLQEGIKRQQVSSSLREANPALAHPAAQPIVAALEAQFTQKYPNATSAEITKMAQDYLGKFATLANPSQPTTESKKAPDDVDWDAFMQS